MADNLARLGVAASAAASNWITVRASASRSLETIPVLTFVFVITDAIFINKPERAVGAPVRAPAKKSTWPSSGDVGAQLCVVWHVLQRQ